MKKLDSFSQDLFYKLSDKKFILLHHLIFTDILNSILQMSK